MNMKLPLPVNGFKWVSDEDLKIWNCDGSS